MLNRLSVNVILRSVFLVLFACIVTVALTDF